MDVLLRYASVSTNYYTDSISIFQSRNKPVLCAKYFIGTAWGNQSNVELYPLNSTRVRFPEVAQASLRVSTTTKTAKFSNFIYKVLVLLSYDTKQTFLIIQRSQNIKIQIQDSESAMLNYTHVKNRCKPGKLEMGILSKLH